MDKKITKEMAERIYKNISPFEFKDILVNVAKQNNKSILDAGRGNPNWLSTIPREAFFILGLFAMEESKRNSHGRLTGSMPLEHGISSRYLNYIYSLNNKEIIKFLSDVCRYGVETLKISSDEWIFELTNAILGCNYPYPDRMLTNIEKSVNNYLKKELFGYNEYDSNFDVFATEGGAAAMCYIFDSLFKNKLLNKGDKIALMTPIFTPYLEIPMLPEYDFEVVHINADEVDNNGYLTYQYSAKELSKLEDTTIKAVFIVNPNNPASISLDDTSKSYLRRIIHNINPNLMIITDDVYCTFVNNFRSIISELPYNTLGVYSYSKYFGVTGWRLGTIILNKENIFNHLISLHNEEVLAELNNRYKHLSSNPQSISFIDRIVADSRGVALNHTAGLSTPQQVQMALFSIYAITNNDSYKRETISICKLRKAMLNKGMRIDNDNTNLLDASYYTIINFLEWIGKELSIDIANMVEANENPFNIIYDLASEFGVIVLPGEGFASSKWEFRISLANLSNEECFIVGQAIRNIFDKIVTKYTLF